MEATTTLKRCPLCNYRLDGLPAEHRCPECGFTYDADTRVFKESGRYYVLGTVAYGAAALVLLGTFFAIDGFSHEVEYLLIVVMLLRCFSFAVRLLPLLRNRTQVILSKTDLRLGKNGKDVTTLQREDVIAAQYSPVTGQIEIRTRRGLKDFPLSRKFFGSYEGWRTFIDAVNRWAQLDMETCMLLAGHPKTVRTRTKLRVIANDRVTETPTTKDNATSEPLGGEA